MEKPPIDAAVLQESLPETAEPETPPEKPQHMDALVYAHEIKSERAAFLREIQAGELSIVEVLEKPSFARMRAMDLVRSAPCTPGRRRNLRRVKAVQQEVELSDTVTVRSLTERQRALLTQALAKHGFLMPGTDPSEKFFHRPQRRNRTPEQELARQRQASLEKANQVRMQRKAIKQSLREQAVSFEEVIDDPAVATMPIEKLFSAAGVGKGGSRRRVGTREILKAARISPHRTVCGLAESERQLLFSLLDQYGYPVYAKGAGDGTR